MKKIIADQARQIIDIACASWKDILMHKWSKSIVSKKIIVISDNDYTTMRNSCTKEQHALFDSIFGKLKVGDWFKIVKSSTSNNKLGDIDIITEENDFHDIYRVTVNNRINSGNWLSSYDLVLATEQEIKQAKHEILNFKIGDLVVVLEEDKYYNNSDHKKACELVKINLVDSVLPYWVKLANNTTNCYKHIRKATDQEIQEYRNFKIGDWVIGWQYLYNNYHKTAWQIEDIRIDVNCILMYNLKKESWHNVAYLRFATDEEILSANHQ